MSNPATHAPVASATSHGSHPPRPPAANHPPTGATAKASPRNSWVYVVKRFASEYQNTMPSATGDSARQIQPSWVVTRMKATEAATTRTTASPDDMTLRGSSRFAVRGFAASNRASTNRLNPMAAVRAATMAATIHATRVMVIGACRAARRAPTRANGRANTECPNRTKDA